MLGSLERHPWRWTLALLLPLIVFPQIDIGVSGLFFQPETRTFVLRTHPLGDFVRKTLPLILFVLAAAIALAGLGAAWRKRPVAGLSPRLAAFVVAALALGPGLVVNTLFKDNWGRPRPSTIVEFGGQSHYVRAGWPSNQCPDNCSFPSGHAALGFWMVAVALAAPAAWRRPAVIAALVFGTAVGVVRIAQGGHFLSDVVFSGVIVVGLTLGLRRLILPPSERPSRKNNGWDWGQHR